MCWCRIVAVCFFLSPLPAALCQEEKTETIVSFPDKSLDSVIREILKRKGIEKETITGADLDKIYFLNANNKSVKDLSGLQYCENLAEVRLSENEISDIGPLAACVQIQSLDISGNRIQNIDALRALKNIRYLNIERNEITSLDGLDKMKQLGSLYAGKNRIQGLAPLKGLAKLHALYVANNAVVDVSVIGTLPKLSSLDLRENNVVDIQALKSLQNLRWTFLSDNQIKDLTPLADMASADHSGQKQFAPYWRLFVEGNPLNDSAENHIQALRRAGVKIRTKRLKLPQPKRESETAKDNETIAN